jgi:hypothetical protein
MKKEKKTVSRRDFLNSSAKLATGSLILSGFPTIVPASVFGKYAPSNLMWHLLAVEGSQQVMI